MDRTHKELISAISAALSIGALAWGFEYFKNHNVPEPVALVICGVLFAFGLGIVLKYAPTLKAVSVFRSVYHQKKYEGLWVQTVELPDRPFAISTIYYDRGKNVWIYRGYAFTEDLQQAAEWKSYSITYTYNNRWFFYGRAWLLNQQSGAASAYKGNVVGMLQLPDHHVNGIEDALITDIGIDGDGPNAFRVSLVRAKPDICLNVFKSNRRPFLDQMTSDQLKSLLHQHLEAGHIPRSFAPSPLPIP